MKTDVVSTIGAGDAFNAGMVYYLEKIKDENVKINELDASKFRGMLGSGLKFSAAVCATMDNYVPSNFS